MKKLLCISLLSFCMHLYAADQASPKSQGVPTKYPGVLHSRTMPDQNDKTAAKYTWFKEMSSGDYVGFLNVVYWDHCLNRSRLSRRMSFGEYEK